MLIPCIAFGTTKTSVGVTFDNYEYVGVHVMGLDTANMVSFSGELGTFRPDEKNEVLSYFAFGGTKRVVSGLFLNPYFSFATENTAVISSLGIKVLYAVPFNDLDIEGIVFSVGYDDLVGMTIGFGGYW